MRTHALLFLLLVSTSALDAQLKVDASGNIGIGTNPSLSCKLSVFGNSFLNGNVGIDTVPSTSYKLNVKGGSSLG